MANIKSQKKRNLTNEKRRKRNRAVKSELKTAVRRVREAVESGNGAEAYEKAQIACRLMDKAVTKGVLHKNQAANRKSGIMKLVNPIVTEADIAAYEKPKPKKANTGSKKAKRKEERNAEMAKASEEKAKRREKQLKEEEKAAKRKAKEAEEAAKAAAEAEAESDEAAAEADAEEAAVDEAAAENDEGTAEEAEVVEEAEEEAPAEEESE